MDSWGTVNKSKKDSDTTIFFKCVTCHKEQCYLTGPTMFMFYGETWLPVEPCFCAVTGVEFQEAPASRSQSLGENTWNSQAEAETTTEDKDSYKIWTVCLELKK